MLRRTGDNEGHYCAVIAAAEHTSCHISTQRCHCQFESEVEHDAFPSGDKVLISGHVTLRCTSTCYHSDKPEIKRARAKARILL